MFTPSLVNLALVALLAAAFVPRATTAASVLPQSAIRNPQSVLTVAVLDFGEGEAGRRASEHFARMLSEAGDAGAYKLRLVDRELARAAARGVGYRGSLNLTLREARDLAASVGCDFLITGDAQTLRRSPAGRPAYFEAYASVFLVSAHTGRLVRWERPAAEGPTPESAEAALSAALDARAAARHLDAAARERAREETPRAEGPTPALPLVDLSREEAGAREDVREPAPYRRLRPAYTEEAARAEAEATVDALVEIDADGRVARVEVVRWAGFGLDESVAEAARAMHFRPATRDGEPVPSRVLLRYNFRRPAPEKKEKP
jgi:TonB family protein